MKTLKKMSIGLLLLVLALPMGCKSYESFTTGTDRQSTQRLNKSIIQEARRLRASGYAPEIGAPAIEYQLRRAFEKEFETDENGQNLNVIGAGSAIAGIENAARMHAVTDAAINASILIESKIMGLIENDFNNQLYSRDEFRTLSRMKGVFSNLLAQTLPTGVPVTTFVRDNKRHYEYQVRIAYPMTIVKDNSASVIADILGKENDQLREKFERITGLNRLGE